MSALFVFVLIPLSAIWSGFALSHLWGWFIVPFGAPVIGVAHAIGIHLVMDCFKTITRSTEKTDDDIKEARIHAVVIAALKPGLLLMFGMAAKWFMPSA